MQDDTSPVPDPGDATESVPVAVYRCYDADDELIYVGQTKHPELRWRQHRYTSPWWAETVRYEAQWLPNRAAARAEELSIIHRDRPWANGEAYRNRRALELSATEYREFISEHSGMCDACGKFPKPIIRGNPYDLNAPTPSYATDGELEADITEGGEVGLLCRECVHAMQLVGRSSATFIRIAQYLEHRPELNDGGRS